MRVPLLQPLSPSGDLEEICVHSFAHPSSARCGVLEGSTKQSFERIMAKHNLVIVGIPDASYNGNFG